MQREEGGAEMGLKKYGVGDGEVLPEEGDAEARKTAAADWTEEDERELAEENKGD